MVMTSSAPDTTHKDVKELETGIGISLLQNCKVYLLRA